MHDLILRSRREYDSIYALSTRNVCFCELIRDSYGILGARGVVVLDKLRVLCYARFTCIRNKVLNYTYKNL
jgi:hypothetical protein